MGMGRLQMCEDFFRRFPLRDGETCADMIRCYWPAAEVLE